MTPQNIQDVTYPTDRDRPGECSRIRILVEWSGEGCTSGLGLCEREAA